MSTTAAKATTVKSLKGDLSTGTGIPDQNDVLTYYDAQQVAALFDIHVNTLYEHIRTGLITRDCYMRIGKSYRFTGPQIYAIARRWQAASEQRAKVRSARSQVKPRSGRPGRRARPLTDL